MKLTIKRHLHFLWRDQCLPSKLRNLPHFLQYFFLNALLTEEYRWLFIVEVNSLSGQRAFIILQGLTWRTSTINVIQTKPKINHTVQETVFNYFWQTSTCSSSLETLSGPTSNTVDCFCGSGKAIKEILPWLKLSNKFVTKFLKATNAWAQAKKCLDLFWKEEFITQVRMW